MTVILELLPEMETRLRRRAKRAGQDLPSFLLAVADREAQEETEEEEVAEDEQEGSAYDLFAGRIGRINGLSEANWSENCGEKFTEGMVEKRRQGHL